SRSDRSPRHSSRLGRRRRRRLRPADACQSLGCRAAYTRR
ncbi:hypothetical protein NJB14197_15720, partial [Mycobacterium montefiorense]